jgi:cell division septum initiation protein DivIVA
VQPAPKPARPVAVIPECADEAPDVTTPLGDDATAGDIAAASARFRRAADLATERARDGLTEAQRVLADAQADADRILREAKQAAQQLQRDARTATGEAELMANNARSMAFAAQRALEGEAAAELAAKLEAERDELTGKAAELARRSQDLAAEQAQQNEALAAARDAGDLDKMTTVKARIAAIGDLAATLGSQLDAVNARLATIGTGSETYDPQRPHEPLPPLAKARQTADRGRSETFRMADSIWPDSPGATRRAREADTRRAAAALVELSARASDARRGWAARSGTA